MNLDLILLAILLICLVYGLLRGVLQQLISLIALLVGLMVSWLALYLSNHLISSTILLRTFAGIVAFIIAYIAVKLFGKRLIRAKAVFFSKGFEDRLWGGLFVLVKGAIIILLVIWIFVCVGEEWVEGHTRLARCWSESRIVQWARTNNLIADSKPMLRLRGLFTALQDPAARELIGKQRAYIDMIGNANYRAIRTDTSLKEALIKKDWLNVIRNRRLLALLEDETFWKDFCTVSWKAALKRRSSPAIESRVRVHEVPTPSPPAPSGEENQQATQLPIERLEESGAREVDIRPSNIVLKNGSVMRGNIISRTPSGIVLEILMDSGVAKIKIATDEIERIEEAGNASRKTEKQPIIQK